MRVDQGHASLASPIGSILSIVLAVILLAYTALKVDSYVNKKGVDIKVTNNQDYYSSQYEFTADMGLNVAFALDKPSSPYGKPVLMRHAYFEAHYFELYINEEGALGYTSPP